MGLSFRGLTQACFHAWHGRIFSALIFIRCKDSSISFAYSPPVIPIGRRKLKSSGPNKLGFAFFITQRAF
jgi:hypothetical protein